MRSRNVGHSWRSIPPTRIAVSFSIGRSCGSPSEGAGGIRLGTAPQSPHPRIWDWQGSRISWLFPVETTGYSKLLLRLLQPFLIPGLRYSPRDLGRSVWHGVGFLYWRWLLAPIQTCAGQALCSVAEVAVWVFGAFVTQRFRFILLGLQFCAWSLAFSDHSSFDILGGWGEEAPEPREAPIARSSLQPCAWAPFPVPCIRGGIFRRATRLV